MVFREEPQHLTPRDVITIIVFAVLVIAYITLVTAGYVEEAKKLGELLGLVVMAIVSYYLGASFSQRKLTEEKEGEGRGRTIPDIARVGHVKFTAFDIFIVSAWVVLTALFIFTAQVTFIVTALYCLAVYVVLSVRRVTSVQ